MVMVLTKVHFMLLNRVMYNIVYVYKYVYRVSQEECARLREGVPYVKVY